MLCTHDLGPVSVDVKFRITFIKLAGFSLMLKHLRHPGELLLKANRHSRVVAIRPFNQDLPVRILKHFCRVGQRTKEERLSQGPLQESRLVLTLADYAGPLDTQLRGAEL